MYLLNTAVPAQTFRAENKLLDTSWYISDVEHNKWSLALAKKRSKGQGDNYWSKLYVKQGGICNICNQPLGFLLESHLEIHHIEHIKASPSKAGLLSNQQLIHKSCHKLIHST